MARASFDMNLIIGYVTAQIAHLESHPAASPTLSPTEAAIARAEFHGQLKSWCKDFFTAGVDPATMPVGMQAAFAAKVARWARIETRKALWNSLIRAAMVLTVDDHKQRDALRGMMKWSDDEVRGFMQCQTLVGVVDIDNPPADLVEALLKWARLEVPDYRDWGGLEGRKLAFAVWEEVLAAVTNDDIRIAAEGTGKRDLLKKVSQGMDFQTAATSADPVASRAAVKAELLKRVEEYKELEERSKAKSGLTFGGFMMGFVTMLPTFLYLLLTFGIFWGMSNLPFDKMFKGSGQEQSVPADQSGILGGGSGADRNRVDPGLPPAKPQPKDVERAGQILNPSGR